ncbi:hypothetical protein F4810DRAFT_710417 [Camillea tinctor]|nr:hypothetical protein F4810DRAFT_710417 [Camillea tinctor]
MLVFKLTKWSTRIATYFPIVQGKFEVLKRLDSTSLEFTAVLNGCFLDYWVLPKVKSYLDPLTLVIEVANNVAAIPGSGDVPKESYIIGDKVTWNEFLRVVEEAKGVKFTVTQDPMDELKAGRITELPSHPHMYPSFPKEMSQGLFAAFGRMFEEGVFDLKHPNTLNDQFPDIKTRTIRELVFEAWKKS